MSVGFLFFHFKNLKRAWGGGGGGIPNMSVGFLFFHFKNLKRAWGGGGGGRRDRRRGKRSLGGGGGGGGGVGTVDGNGDGEAPTCSKWVGFPRLFFPSWLRLL